MVNQTVEHFIKNGIDYYAAARFAARAQLMPVCGNIYHHAVEMLLKGNLAQTQSLEQLKRISHRLPQLWDAYKATLPTVDLARFDQVVSLLDAFEEIRYPNKIIKHGAQIALTWDAPPGGMAGKTLGDPTPAYNLVVKEIDRLVAAIIRNGPMNPAFLASRLEPHAFSEVTYDNPATASGCWLSST
jgi:hypothetical protein